MRVVSPLRALSVLCLVWMLASCGATLLQSEVEACRPLRAADCVVRLDKNQLTLQQGNAVLREVAIIHLKDENLDAATSYLSLAIKREPTDGVAYRLRGDAYTRHAEIRQQDTDDMVPHSVGWHSAVAFESYGLATIYEPENQSNYRNAVSSALMIDQCDFANRIRAQHERKFGITSDQIAMADMIKKKCEEIR
jgi:hypothetical protein